MENKRKTVFKKLTTIEINRMLGYLDAKANFNVSFSVNSEFTLGIEVRPSFSCSASGSGFRPSPSSSFNLGIDFDSDFDSDFGPGPSPSSSFNPGIDFDSGFGVSSSSPILNLMQQNFGCGSIKENGKEDTLKYEVRSIEELNGTIISFFKKHPLQGKKNDNFLLFSEICLLMSSKEHLTEEGLVEIIYIGYEMNPDSGRRKYTKEELLEVLKKSLEEVKNSEDLGDE